MPNSVRYSAPSYTGNGSSRTGTTSVTMDFILPGGSREAKTEVFTEVNRVTERTTIYEFDGYAVTVLITVNVSGSNNQMNIIGATARITNQATMNETARLCKAFG